MTKPTVAQRVLCVCLALCSVAALAQQAPDVEPPKEAGKDVPAPKRTKTVAPVYPPDAQAQGLRGIVIIELIVDTQGKVASAAVVRSVPPFDEAALAAVRKWEYEVTRLDGRPVSVHMTVPISFAMRLPEATRQEGIPELRQGVAPGYPAGAQGGASVTAQVTLDAEGRVADAEVRSGGPPWDEALLQALRTWRFALPAERGVLSFRVQADFLEGSRGMPPRVTLTMNGLQEGHSFGSGSEVAAAAPGPTTVAPPQPPASVVPDAAPDSSAKPAEPTAPDHAKISAAGPPPAPPVEVISAPPPAADAPVPGVSAVADVTLGAGVPDLVTGRRPLPPPLARMSRLSGTVEVRFSIDAAGQTTLKGGSIGPELLQAAAEDAVRTWKFRRTSAERLHVLVVFGYGNDAASATLTLEP